MNRNFLLPVCLLTLTCASRAFAQAPAPVTATPPQDSGLTHIPAMTFSAPAEKTTVPMQTAKANLGRAQIRVLAPSRPCYTMRSYAFTDGDLNAGAPHPSTVSTCTPAASNQMKRASPSNPQ